MFTLLCYATHCNADACRDGTFFVADGYCNSRLVKFSKDGKYLGEAAFKEGQVG